MAAISGGASVEAPAPSISLREAHGSFIDETIAIASRQRRDTVLLSVGSPAPEALEMTDAADLAATVIARDGPAALGYGITEGDPELRELIRATAHQDGLLAGEVIVTAGALQAVDLACRALVRPGDVAVVESPGFANAISALRNQGARLLEVPADDDGLDVAAAERIIHEASLRPRLFFVVPDHQNPSGATLSIERRAALVDLARRHGAAIIEDSPYRALRYRGLRLPTIASLADGVPVIHCGSFSKVFLPGIRVGWALAPEPVVRAMTSLKQTLDSSTSSLGQRMVVEFHRRGRMSSHVERLRALYGEKQRRARGALERWFAGTGVSWNDPDGGFYLWVRLPGRLRSRRLFEVGLEEGVAFVPGDAFGVERDHADAFRLSYSWPSAERIEEGVSRLRAAFERLLEAR